jgi:dynein heavy chain
MDVEAPKVYESIGTFDNLKERLKMFMGSYNEAIRGGRLDLVFFRVS